MADIATHSGMTEPPTAASMPVRFVDWGAVVAGAVMAAAISFVLLTFGTSIGLSLVSPWQESSLSVSAVLSLAAFWVLLQQIAAFIAGGYIAGRMRPRWTETNADEVEFRDGLHGGLVWALGVIITTLLALSTAGSLIRSGTEAAGRVASAAASNVDPVAYQIDAMLRPGQPGSNRPAATPGGPQPGSPAAGATDPRAELARIFARSVATGTIADNDRAYVASVVSQRTGLPQAEAERRVTTAFDDAKRATKDAADKARKTAVLSGFVTAAGVMLSLGAAWWAAVQGGKHRDNSIPARFPFNYRRPMT